MSAGNSTVRVLVTKFADRKFWLAYYDCPLSGKRFSRSTKETTQKAAEKFAAKWESELQEGRHKPKLNVTWEEFRETFLHEHLKGAAIATFKVYSTSFHALERHCQVNRLAELTTERIRFVAQKLRGEGLSVATIGTYLRHIKAALRWANENGMLNTVPKIERIKGSAGKMKGRPITLEEFERMLGKVETVLADPRLQFNAKEPAKRPIPASRQESRAAQAKLDAPAWRRLLHGLWLCGLRLGEALALTWDDDTQPLVELSGKFPMLHIPAGCQKGNRDTVTPIVPDFLKLLEQTPREQRHGLVFPLMTRGKPADLGNAGKTISAIGEAAGVVVDKAAGKFATAHDLRRSFGTRWALVVPPVVLKDLMRHADINTTMKYYVGQDTDAMAASIWAAVAAQPQAKPDAAVT